ncbi:unnamed protein product, partial [marine sediment metagenome]
SIFVKAERRNPVNLGLTNIAGEYVHKFNRNDGKILIINSDGTFESKGESTLRSDWEINGNKIVFYFHIGQQRIQAASLSGELRGNTLYSAGGSIWAKQRGRRKEREEIIEGYPESSYAARARELLDERTTITRANLKILHSAVNQFALDTGRFPTEEERLTALISQPSDVANYKPGGYLQTLEILKD